MVARMKYYHWLQFISAGILVAILIYPMSAAFASEADHPVSMQKIVTASAVIVPAQVSKLGLLISAIAKDIPVSEGDSVTAGQTLIALDTPDLQYAVVEAQAALHSTQAYADLQKYQKVKHQRNGKIFYDPIPEEYGQRADASVQQAQVALELAQINFNESMLSAPFDGTIASIKVIPGEFVPSDEAVITLATLNNLQVETIDLSESDIAKVKIGSPVEITIEALNESFNGKVIAISPIADTVGGDVVFKVTVAFDEQPKNLLWGMTAEVNISE